MPPQVPPLGARVQVHLGPYIMVGTMVEDRGNTGANGQRIVRVAVPIEGNTVATYELPLSQVKVIGPKR